MKLILIKVWRIYQIFLISFLVIALIYDIISLTSGNEMFVFVALDVLFLGAHYIKFLNCSIVI